MNGKRESSRTLPGSDDRRPGGGRHEFETLAAAAVLFFFCAAGLQGEKLVPQCSSLTQVEFVYRQRLSKTLCLDRQDRDLYAQMLIIPSFEGEKCVSLYGPGPNHGMKITVAEAGRNLWLASFEELRRADKPMSELLDLPFDAAVRRWEAPLDEPISMGIVTAFAAALKKARFVENPPLLADPTIYEFRGLLVGFGIACARLKIRQGSVPRHGLYRLGMAMDRYAKASPEDKPMVAAELEKLIEEMTGVALKR